MPLLDELAFPLALTLAFTFGLAVRQIGLPPLVGFLAAGFVLRGVGLESHATIDVIGDFGVLILLFTIGLKLRLEQLARPPVWLGASAHAIVTSGTLAALWWFVGMSPVEALLLGFALSFSSTVFTVKVFEDRGELGASFANVAIGILVMQDLFAVVFLSVSGGTLPSPWAVLLVGLLAARPLLHRLLERSGHGELLPLFGLFAAVGLGSTLFGLVGLKPDLGALVLGMLLAGHPRASDVAGQLFAFKEVLLVGFFLQIGLSGLPGWTELTMAVLFLLLLPLKSLLFVWLLCRLGLRARSSFLAALSLTTYSEFGLIVVGLATAEGWLDPSWLVALAVAVALSFLVAAPLNSLNNQFYERLRPWLRSFEQPGAIDTTLDELGPVRIVVFGMGRVGTAAYDRLRMDMGDVALGVDADPLTVAAHQRAGRRVVLGDATDVEWWARITTRMKERRRRGMVEVGAVVLALPAQETNLYVLDKIVASRFAGTISAIAYNEEDAQHLKDAGATSAFEARAEAGIGLASQIRARIDAASPNPATRLSPNVPAVEGGRQHALIDELRDRPHDA